MNSALHLRERDVGDRVPFCQIVKAGDFLWVTGQVAFDKERNLVGPGDIKAQTRQIFINMRRVLRLAGLDLVSIVRLHTYLTIQPDNSGIMDGYWDVLREEFGDHRPAGTAIWVAALGSPTPGMMIEIDALAYAPNAVIDPDAQILNAAA